MKNTSDNGFSTIFFRLMRYAYGLVAYSLPGGRRLWEAEFPAYPGLFAFDSAPGACGERVYVAGIAGSNGGAPEALLIAREARSGLASRPGNLVGCREWRFVHG